MRASSWSARRWCSHPAAAAAAAAHATKDMHNNHMGDAEQEALREERLRSRYAARLTRIPHDVLVSAICSLVGGEPALRARLENSIQPHLGALPQWTLDEVLLSPDLLHNLFESLRLEDWRAACVCTRTSRRNGRCRCSG